MRGSGSWTEDELPNSYREGILFLYPNGSAPLTAIMAKLKSKKETNPYFDWFTKDMPPQGCEIPTASGGKVFTNEGRGTPYSAGTAAAGDTLVVNLTGDFAKLVRTGTQVMFRKANDHSADVIGRVTNVVRGNDASSFATVMLIEADKGGSAAGAKDADRFLIVGNINPEGGTRPQAVSRNAQHFVNYMQIFRNSLSQTRTNRQTSGNRLGDSYAELKRETLEFHSIEMEDAFIWGPKSVRMGDNGQPERTTQGIVNTLRMAEPDNVIDAARISAYSGKEFYEFGHDLLLRMTRQIFEYGTSTERFCLVGNGAMMAIQNLVMDNSQYNIEANEAAYGVKVATVTTIFGQLHFKTSPRFTNENSNSHSMLIVDPNDLEYRFLQDTSFMGDPNYMKGGESGRDGLEEEFLTEAGLAYYHPKKGMYVSNFGLDTLI
jgi:hypothetical protein